MSIRENIVDLLDPFKSGWYYNPAMGKSFSIKSVLPALFPDDPELNYHNLEDIHNGSEAMNAFPAMEHMEPEELERTRRNLLKYCELERIIDYYPLPGADASGFSYVPKLHHGFCYYVCKW